MVSTRRAPRVMVPVLSSRSVSTLPAASTAIPDLAITFTRIRRPMPTMPKIERRPAVAVGSMAPNIATKSAARSMPANVRGHRAQQQHAGDGQQSRSQKRQREPELARVEPPPRLGDLLADLGEQAVAEIGGNPEPQPVRQDPCAADHGGAIAAALADDRGGFAGDRGSSIWATSSITSPSAGMTSPACTRTTSPTSRVSLVTVS